MMAVVLLAATSARAEVLISAQEAALPPATGAKAVTLVSRGMYPPPAAALKPVGDEASPITFKVELRAYGGARIDPDTVRITYLKAPLINLTPRLRKYITEKAIIMPDAEVPAGEHKLRIELEDSDGHKGASTITLVVRP